MLGWPWQGIGKLGSTGVRWFPIPPISPQRVPKPHAISTRFSKARTRVTSLWSRFPRSSSKSTTSAHARSASRFRSRCGCERLSDRIMQYRNVSADERSKARSDEPSEAHMRIVFRSLFVVALLLIGIEVAAAQDALYVVSYVEAVPQSAEQARLLITQYTKALRQESGAVQS